MRRGHIFVLLFSFFKDMMATAHGFGTVNMMSPNNYYDEAYTYQTSPHIPYHATRLEGESRSSSNLGNSSKSAPVNHDHPAFSRVFLVCSKSHTAEELRATAEEYGVVEDVWVVKDKHTKESRGVAYIKFSKMSEATLAVEKLDGKAIGSDPKPIKSLLRLHGSTFEGLWVPSDLKDPFKAIIAQSKASKSTADFNDESALTRLFVVIPKSYSEEELKTKFGEYGDIDYVQIVKDKKTRESKGFGYVKFYRPYSAAMALENCDKQFKAVMAEPKSARFKTKDTVSEAGSHVLSVSGGHEYVGMMNEVYAPPAFAMSLGMPDGRSMSTVGNRLQVTAATSVTQDQIARLFDLIPGMELCDLKKNYSTGESKGVAYVIYNSVGSAIYAKEKLHGFEYPPGCKLSVKYAPDEPVAAGGTSVTEPAGAMVPAPYTTAALPAPKPLADSKAETAERLFIVCSPNPPPDTALKDVFSRFGDLIDVYMLKNKNFGYAKYANADSAKKAMEAVHGQEILGVKLKVMAADPPKGQDPARKRPRT